MGDETMTDERNPESRDTCFACCAQVCCGHRKHVRVHISRALSFLCHVHARKCTETAPSSSYSVLKMEKKTVPLRLSISGAERNL